MRSLKTLSWLLFATLFTLITAFILATVYYPLQPLEAHTDPNFETVFTAPEAPATELSEAFTKPTAFGWAESSAVWSNTEEVFPLASISKVISVLVTLEASPLNADVSTWGNLVITHEDFELQEEYRSEYGVAYFFAPGSVVPLKDVYKLIFLPSDNGAVAAYVNSVFPTREAFLDAVYSWAAKNEINSLRFVEPSGMDGGNMASPADLVKIGRIALNNPVVSQFISMKYAYVPEAGDLENTNPLLGIEPGVVGIKTGRSLAAGFNFLVAAKDTVHDREITRIAVTMARDSVEERASSGKEVLDAVKALPQEILLVKDKTPIAFVTTWQGDRIDLLVGGDASAMLLPGEEATMELTLPRELTNAEAGERVGELHITTPTGGTVLGITLSTSIEEPNIWWRLQNPKTVLQLGE